jgi:hypothetical protein
MSKELSHPGAQSSVAPEFQRRRRNYLKWQVPSLLLFFGAVFGGIMFPPVPKWLCGTVAIFAFVIGISSTKIANYRCPRCDTVPLSDGIAPNPSKCAQCGALFR